MKLANTVPSHAAEPSLTTLPLLPLNIAATCENQQPDCIKRKKGFGVVALISDCCRIKVFSYMTFTRFSASATVQGWPYLPIANQICLWSILHLSTNTLSWRWQRTPKPISLVSQIISSGFIVSTTDLVMCF